MPKPEKAYRKKQIAGHQLAPETLVMGYGFDPHLSEGSIKPPIFQTSTFVFRTAEDGAAFFAKVRGEEGTADQDPGLIYTRINNPNLEVLEDRLTLYDGGEDALAFASGMGAITTALLSFVEPGSVVLHSGPLYGGTEGFVRDLLPKFGAHPVEFFASAPESEIRQAVAQAQEQGPITVIYTETPANPTNDLVDLELMARIRDEIAAIQGVRPVLMCDNTILGPVGQAPIRNGVDLVLYSLTKYVGGHSDLIAGAAIGSAEAVARVRPMRTVLGGVPDPHTCWLLLRSLETVKLRMEASFANAQACAEFLRDHPKVERVRYLGFLEPGSAQRDIYDRHCTGAGSTFSFDVAGGREGAFRMLNRLSVIKLAVSLGGTESLMCHPGSTTHSGVPRDLRMRLGFTPGLVRFSVGLEHPDDLIADLNQALEGV